MHLLKISIGALFLIKVNFLDFLCLTFYSKVLFHDPHNPFPIGLLFEGSGDLFHQSWGNFLKLKVGPIFKIEVIFRSRPHFFMILVKVFIFSSAHFQNLNSFKSK